MVAKKRFWIFCISLVLGAVFWRAIFYLRNGEVALLREITGLSFHHYTYGILIVFIAALFLIFYKVDKYSIALMGFGLGSIFDGFVSRLFSSSARSVEITNYNAVVIPTILLFLILISLSACFYLVNRK